MVMRWFMTNFLTNVANLKEIPISLFPHPLFLAATALIIIALFFLSKPHNVYLIDFCCYKPPNSLRAPISSYVEHFERCDKFNEKSISFLTKVCLRSGIGSEACAPDSLQKLPPSGSMADSLEEIKIVLFTTVKDLLEKHKINPKTIDILVSNCSLVCSIPSITSMIINKFGFRSDVMSFSLTGMGCSAGILSISLAKDLLKVHKNSLALVLSMEAISTNGYTGRDKSMLLANTLFRMGGAAILLSNRKQHKRVAKYALQHIVRTNMAPNNESYKSVFQEMDGDGLVGVLLSTKLIYVAWNALRTNMTTLGPLVLPYFEQFRYAWSLVFSKIWAHGRTKHVLVPNFKTAFEHFCVHTGGRAVIDAVEDSLSLCKEDGEASRMALYRFGNTSSSSVWYELSYLEAKGRVKRGDRIWQIAFGSGFKCNSAVWKCISDLDPNVRNAWSDRIHRYPVDIPDVFEH